MMNTFNPFALFHHASHAELDSAVAYLRDFVNANEWEVQAVPPATAERPEARTCGHRIARLRRRIGRR
jgi:hypothetical protein